MANTWIVYKHTFPDGRNYIGITSKTAGERWKDGFGYIEQRRFFAEIVYTGWDNIKHEVLHEGLSESKARKMEMSLIAEEWRLNKSKSLNTQFITGKKNRTPRVIDNGWRELHRKPQTQWTINGETKPARDWCYKLGVSYSNITTRMKKYGLTLEQAIEFPKVPKLYQRDAMQYWRSLGLITPLQSPLNMV